MAEHADVICNVYVAIHCIYVVNSDGNKATFARPWSRVPDQSYGIIQD